MKKLTALCLAVGTITMVSLLGCGGSGGGGGTSGGGSAPGRSRAAVLVTDSLREEYGHVWATIYRVELVPEGDGSAVVLFDDPTGRQIDLKTLRDASGSRYSFLGNATVPDGTYTGVNVTLGDTMQLFRNGVATGDPIAVDAEVPRDASGRPVVFVTFKKAKTLSASAGNVIVDFDLARFVLRGSKVLPALVEGDGAGLNDPRKHEKDEYRGTVSGLTGAAPDLTFTLNRGNGMSATVVTTAATALYGAETLQDGSVVAVTATLDPATQNLVATRVEVRRDGAPAAEAEGNCAPRAAGAAADIDAAAGTFTLTPRRARGFTPGQTTVKVVTNAATSFRGDAGETQTAADFFAALAATPEAVVEGTYDVPSNTVTATSAKVMDARKDGGWRNGPRDFRGGPGAGNRWGNDAFAKRND